MRVIITAGGTKEKIDKVRTITNISSGKLSSIIADQFMALKDITEVIYVCTSDAILPELPNYTKYVINNVDDLYKTLNMLILTSKIDVVIHAMAVSDYTVDKITTLSNIYDVSNNVAKQECLIANLDDLSKQDKINSSLDDLTIILKKTPKVINYIKQWDPNIILVGFKLLDSVPHFELMNIAVELAKKNQCDFVLANDYSLIDEYQHLGWLVNRDGKEFHANTKLAIAQMIVDHTYSKFTEVK